jgi:hypothetical protein
MADYSGSDKLLHRVYLGNYPISLAALEMEEILYGKKAKQAPVKEMVFVTGLARSGTTAVMNKIFMSGEFASLQYSNMPFLLNPNLWKRKSEIAMHERAHGDGIYIDGNSPEEFDEYFWKAALKDSFIKENGLELHDVSDDLIRKFSDYVHLICLAKGKNKYLSKNNNNILRFKGICSLPNQKTIVMMREPLAHASSLLKLHLQFCKEQEEDPFVLEYFDYLGHHEFGKHHKPFLLTDEFEERRNEFKTDDINYWLSVWLNYYKHVLKLAEQSPKVFMLIRFEDLIEEPNTVINYLVNELNLESEFLPEKKHTPTSYPSISSDRKLATECQTIYSCLSSYTQYDLNN